MVKTVSFWLKEIPKEDVKLLKDICHQLGVAGRFMVQEWLRILVRRKDTKHFWKNVEVPGTRAAREQFKQTGYLPDLVSNAGHTEFFVRFKTEFQKMRRGEKAGLPVPGAAPFVYLRLDPGNAQATIEQRDGQWYLCEPRLFVDPAGTGRNAGRAWQLKGRSRDGWEYRQLENAEKLGCVRIMPDRREPWKWLARISLHLPEAPPAAERAEREVWAGIDLGVDYPAVLSIPEHKDGGLVRFFGAQYYARLWEHMRQYERLRTLLNKAGKSRAAKQIQPKLEGLRKHVNELISREIVDLCRAMGVTGIRLENLKGLGARAKGRLRSWPRYHLVTRIKQKAAEAGIIVQEINPWRSSMTCSACGHCHKDNLQGRSFKCLSCGFARHRDVNAANNMARGMKDFDLPAGASGGESHARRLRV